MNIRQFRVASWGVASLGIMVVAAGLYGKKATYGSSNEADNEERAHGKYLVHRVAHCIQCHTPRTQDGTLDSSRLLTGAPVPVSAPQGDPPWAAESVALAGLGNYDEPFIRHLLTQGVRPDGTQPKNPMPAFQLNRSDADAVIAYLKSVR